MNWEVWNMPRKTSFCNGALLRSDLRRYWPVGALYVLVWLMLLPIPLLQMGHEYTRVRADDPAHLAALLASGLHEQIYNAMTGSLVLAVVCGAAVPMAVYAYLMTPRAVGMMHALPVKRSTQFCTHLASGFGLLTAGNLLIFLLSVLAQAPYAPVDWAALGLWLLVTELMELFFLSLGTLCAMATGWLLAVPVLYGALNFLAILLCIVVQFLQRQFYFGFSYTTYPSLVIWLTPIVKLADAVCGYENVELLRNGETLIWRTLPEGGLTAVAVYAIAGLALLALGWLLYRKRPSETAGDAAAFRWLRPIARWIVGLCGGLGLGLFLCIAVLGGFHGGIVKLLLCQIFMGLLCFFIVQMLLQKTFRVFRRSWKEALALAAAVTALTLLIRADLFGVQNRVPDPAQVEEVTVYVTAYDGGVCTTDDEAVIEKTAALHRAVLAQGEETSEAANGNLYVSFWYQRTNGDPLRREYNIDLIPGSEVYRLANELLNMPQFRQSAIGLAWLDKAEPETVRSGFVEDTETGASADLTREQAKELCRLAQQDAASAGERDVLGDISVDMSDVNRPLDIYRYHIAIYTTGADGKDHTHYLTMMGYCTGMQAFVDTLDFANGTEAAVDTEAAP